MTQQYTLPTDDFAQLAKMHRQQYDTIHSLIKERDELQHQLDGMTDMAAWWQRSSEFYRGLVQRCGEVFGVAAYTADDGSVMDDVLALKVPELVEAHCRPLNRIQRWVLKLFAST